MNNISNCGDFSQINYNKYEHIERKWKAKGERERRESEEARERGARERGVERAG